MTTSTDNFSITLQPSRALFLSLGAVHLLAIVCVIYLSIPVWIKIVPIAFIIFISIKTFKQHVLLTSENSISKLNCTNKKTCKIELNNGKVLQAKLISANWLFAYFAVLVLQHKAKKFKATIAKDTMSQEQFYTLRLYLRSINK